MHLSTTYYYIFIFSVDFPAFFYYVLHIIRFEYAYMKYTL